MTAGPALTTADVARALIESDLIPRYMEYARLSPSMNPAETVEHIAATWAPFVLARLAPAAAESADEALEHLLDYGCSRYHPEGSCPWQLRCDEPGCKREATAGWPTRSGGTTSNGGYRRTCGDHYRAYLAAPEEKR